MLDDYRNPRDGWFAGLVEWIAPKATEIEAQGRPAWAIPTEPPRGIFETPGPEVDDA